MCCEVCEKFYNEHKSSAGKKLLPVSHTSVQYCPDSQRRGCSNDESVNVPQHDIYDEARQAFGDFEKSATAHEMGATAPNLQRG